MRNPIRLTQTVLAFLISITITAQVTVVPANASNLDTNWTNLGDIIIYENNATDIYNSNFNAGLLALIAPNGFEFNGQATPLYSSKPIGKYDIFDLFWGWDPIATTYGNRVIIYEFEFNGGSPMLGDTIILRGLQVRVSPQSPPSQNSGNITRIATSDDEPINGIVNGTTNFGTLSISSISTGNTKEIANNKLDVYPNPFTDHLIIETRQNQSEDTRLVIYDLQGKVIINKSIIKGHPVLLTKKELPRGMYLYQLKSETTVLEKGKIVSN